MTGSLQTGRIRRYGSPSSKNWEQAKCGQGKCRECGSATRASNITILPLPSATSSLPSSKGIKAMRMDMMTQRDYDNDQGRFGKLLARKHS